MDAELVARPLKWNIDNIKRFMVFIGPISSIFDYATFALMWFFFQCSAFAAAGTGPPQQDPLASLFQTGWFVESLLTQTLIVHIIRTRRIPFFESRASVPMTADDARPSWQSGPGCPIRRSPATSAWCPSRRVYWAWIAAFLVTYAALTHVVKTWFFSALRS